MILPLIKIIFISIISVVDEKCLLAYKIPFAVEIKKQQNFWGKFSKLFEKILCKIWKLYGKHFFQQKKF